MSSMKKYATRSGSGSGRRESESSGSKLEVKYVYRKRKLKNSYDNFSQSQIRSQIQVLKSIIPEPLLIKFSSETRPGNKTVNITRFNIIHSGVRYIEHLQGQLKDLDQKYNLVGGSGGGGGGEERGTSTDLEDVSTTAYENSSASDAVAAGVKNTGNDLQVASTLYNTGTNADNVLVQENLNLPMTAETQPINLSDHNTMNMEIDNGAGGLDLEDYCGCFSLWNLIYV